MTFSRALDVIFLTLAFLALPATAAEPRLVCFGNEPSWSLGFGGPGRATLAFSDGKPVEYRGKETRLDFLKERAWRGTPAGDAKGVLVAFLREGECSDGMSETKHPLSARVSLPDGRFLAGCCRIPASPLEGTTWELTPPAGTAGDPKDSKAAPPTVRFADGRASGFSGCNRFTGSYTRDGDTLTVGRLAETMMACPEPRMAAEKAFLDALSGAHRVTIAGDRLTLTPASGNPLAFQAEPPPSLEGVTWSVTGFNNGRQAVVSPRTGTTVTLSFDDGKVAGTTGCNTFRATYTSDGNRISIGPAATTRKACPGEGVMEQERQFLAALTTAKTWTVEGGTLDVHRADGERVLMAKGTGGGRP